MGVGRSERSGWGVGMDEGGKVRWGKAVEGFVCEGGYLEVDLLLDREPVELAAEGGGMIRPFDGRED